MDRKTHRGADRTLSERTVFTPVPVSSPSLINTGKRCGEAAGALAGRRVSSAAS